VKAQNGTDLLHNYTFKFLFLLIFLNIYTQELRHPIKKKSHSDNNMIRTRSFCPRPSTGRDGGSYRNIGGHDTDNRSPALSEGGAGSALEQTVGLEVLDAPEASFA
jgi:hypothetical protein